MTPQVASRWPSNLESNLTHLSAILATPEERGVGTDLVDEIKLLFDHEAMVITKSHDERVDGMQHVDNF